LVEEEEFSKGTTIIEEGEFGNWIWMVLHGTAEMTKKTIAGPTKILRVGQGAFIGNISSMMAMGRRRIATFTATETIRLGVLDLDPLYAEYSSLSDEFRSLLLSLDNRFREITERLSEIHSGIHVSEKAFSIPRKPSKRENALKPLS
jgi:CRP-like cAMP-binding protein